MAPQPGHTVDHTPEYEEFIKTLREYHAQRGTNFEAEPKVGQTTVDLLKLFKAVVENGGYDKISEEKLAWRNMVNALELFSSNEASAAYSLKLAYYKNLAAYEIRTIHNQEPPPPEILEHISAKGGGLLTRTLENFGGTHRTSRPSSVMETTSTTDGAGDDARAGAAAGGTSGSGVGAGSSGGVAGSDTTTTTTTITTAPTTGRASRGLREAPPQRVIFQPDTAPARQSSRHASALGGSTAGTAAGSTAGTTAAGQHSSASASSASYPMHNSFSAGAAANHGQLPPPLPQHAQGGRSASMIYNPLNTEGYSATVAAYEPRGPVPIVLQAVEAPVNAPHKYLQQQRLQRLAVSGVDLNRFARRPPMPPGSEGPNIYVRCLGALRSGVATEEAFALSHLVKISYERGDKYKFESFPGLAEGLFDKALQVGNLFYHDVAWRVSYDLETDETDLGELDGFNGTPDILERIAQLRPREDTLDCVQPEAFADQMVLVTEAALTLRNMVTLPENAQFIAEFPTCRDFLCIVLNLPNRDAVVELKHCALDIAEQVTPFLALGDDDALYQTLLQLLLESASAADRGVVLGALRAVGRISMNMVQMNRLGNVPAAVLQNVMSWLLLNDDELVDACLDFLYQYTAVAANVERLLRSIRAEGLVRHLVRLLSHGATRGHRELVLAAERRTPATATVLTPPAELLARLVATDEPERCYTWLRCMFEEDAEAAITQIAIWQAYQSTFLAAVQASGRNMLGAAEFIRNVTHVYHAAGAQIQKERDARGVEVQKFIIKGIRPRTRPISPEGLEYVGCQWTAAAAAGSKPCGAFFGTAEQLYKHVLTAHLEETPAADGKVANKERALQCRWGGCSSSKYHGTAAAAASTVKLADFMTHVKTHAVQAEQDRDGDVVTPAAAAAAASSSTAAPTATAETTTTGDATADAQGASSPSNPLKHQRQRSSVTNGDLQATAGQPNGTGTGTTTTTPTTSTNKRQKRSFITPATTMRVAYEDTVTVRDERNPNLPPQAAGIPLSAVLVLRNIARNAAKVEVALDERGQVVLQHEDEAAGEREEQQEKKEEQEKQQPSLAKTLARSAAIKRGRTLQTTAGTPTPAARAGRHADGGWNERLFRPMLPRLYEILTENRALGGYVTSLFQLIGEECF